MSGVSANSELPLPALKASLLPCWQGPTLPVPSYPYSPGSSSYGIATLVTPSSHSLEDHIAGNPGSQQLIFLRSGLVQIVAPFLARPYKAVYAPLEKQ